jgi:hypothetical protein
MPWKAGAGSSSWPSPWGVPSSGYGFLSGAWPFGVVEAVWTLIALRRYVLAGRSRDATS